MKIHVTCYSVYIGMTIWDYIKKCKTTMIWMKEVTEDMGMFYPWINRHMDVLCLTAKHRTDTYIEE